MIEFKKVELKDKEWMNEKLKESEYKGCDYTFGNIYIWRNVLRYKVAKVYNTFCLISENYYNKGVVYLYPAGNGDKKKAIEEMRRDAKDRGHIFYMRGIEKEQLLSLETWFPGVFEIEEEREEWDYLYLVNNLTHLTGKKYHGKRNHIARFRDAEEWHYEEMNESNISACKEMNDAWCKEYGCSENIEFVTEQCAVKEAFTYFMELGFVGGVLYQNGKIVAFTIGEPLTKDTFVVHIEKAFSEIQGAYPTINQQFVQRNMQKFIYVNREEDRGKEGLRKAKMSYHPDLLIEKYVAKVKL